MPRGLKAVSLFAGCGGDTLGMEMAGFEVVGFVENWKPAIETHKKNFPSSVLIGESVGGDITKISDEEFLKYRGKISILFAGFPCQGFSHAGKKAPNDPRNKLFWEFVRAAKIIEPDWIVGENVSGLLHRKTDDGKSNVGDVIVSAFESIGYKMAEPRVLKADQYGVPQKRSRVFFVGSKNGKDFAFPEPKKIRASLKKIIEFSLDGAVPINDEKIISQIKTFCESGGSDAPTGKPHPYLVSKEKDKKISFSKRISPNHVEVVDLNAPAKTIHCGYTFQPRLFAAMKNKNGVFLRELSVRELAQIQGFPKDYNFSGKREEIIRQIGNAVPPMLVSEISKSVILSASASIPKPFSRKSLDDFLLSAPKFSQHPIPAS